MIAELVQPVDTRLAYDAHQCGCRQRWSCSSPLLSLHRLVQILPVSIAAVQGGGQQGTSALDVPSIDVTNAHLIASQLIQAGEVDMVLWLKMRLTSIGNDLLTALSQASFVPKPPDLGVPFVVGVTEDAEFVYDVETGNFVNAQYVVMPDGDVVDRYVKVVKVPFGEYIPFRSLLESLGAPTGSSQRCDLWNRACCRRRRWRWHIWSRDLVGGVFGSRGRDAVTSGARCYQSDKRGELHVDNRPKPAGCFEQASSGRDRRWVIQVAPTGFSATVDPSGNVLERSDISEQIVLYSAPMRRSGTTVYTRIGDAPFAIAALLLVIIPMMLTRRSLSPDHRSQSKPSSPSKSAGFNATISESGDRWSIKGSASGGAAAISLAAGHSMYFRTA